MSIDPRTLPDSTVVETTADHFAQGQTHLTTAKDVWIRGDLAIVRVFAPVPDGMDPEKAARILAEHVEWVPLPDGPTEAHVGKRLRRVWDGPSYHTVSVLTPSNVTASLVYSNDRNGHIRRGDWFIHPDDVPQEPEHDPALVEHIARAVHKAARDEKPWDDLPRYVRQQFLDDAEAALTASREWEAR